MTSDWLFMKNVLIPLANSVLVPWGLTAAVSTTDAAIQKKIYGSGMITLVFSNEDLNDIMKIIISSRMWFINKKC